MCITLNPAEITGTRLAGFAKGGRHTIFYGMDAFLSGSSDRFDPFSFGDEEPSATKNAICFSVPTDEPFGMAHFIDVSNAPSLTELMKHEYLRVINEGSRGLFLSAESLSIEIFEVGSWMATVARGRSGSAATILEALATIPEQYRPDVSEDILETFLLLEDPIVMACLKPDAGAHGMEDLVYSFVPRDYDTMILPALDGHGSAPTKGYVQRDHFLFAAVEETLAPFSVPVDDLLIAVPRLESLLPYRDVDGSKILTFEGSQRDEGDDNGDFHIPLRPLTVARSRRDVFSVWPRRLG